MGSVSVAPAPLRSGSLLRANAKIYETVATAHPTFLSVNNQGGYSNAPYCTISSSTQAGEGLVLLMFAGRGVEFGDLVTSGWTDQGSIEHSNSITIRVWTKTAESGDANSTVTGSWSVTDNWTARIIRFSGVDANNPFPYFNMGVVTDYHYHYAPYIFPPFGNWAQLMMCLSDAASFIDWPINSSNVQAGTTSDGKPFSIRYREQDDPGFPGVAIWETSYDEDTIVFALCVAPSPPPEVSPTVVPFPLRTEGEMSAGLEFSVGQSPAALAAASALSGDQAIGADMQAAALVASNSISADRNLGVDRVAPALSSASALSANQNLGVDRPVDALTVDNTLSGGHQISVSKIVAALGAASALSGNVSISAGVELTADILSSLNYIAANVEAIGPSEVAVSPLVSVNDITAGLDVSQGAILTAGVLSVLAEMSAAREITGPVLITASPLLLINSIDANVLTAQGSENAADTLVSISNMTAGLSLAQGAVIPADVLTAISTQLGVYQQSVLIPTDVLIVRVGLEADFAIIDPLDPDATHELIVVTTERGLEELRKCRQFKYVTPERLFHS